MLYEEKKILLHRIICGILLLIGIIVPICVANMPTTDNDIEIVLEEDSGYISDYYEYSGTSVCEIELFFNTEVKSAYTEVAFYGENNIFLGRQEKEFYGGSNGSKRLSSTFYINGEVDGYEIISCDCELPADEVREFAITFIPELFIWIDIILFIIFIGSLLLSCKVYDYNGIEIIVYAGWYHHYIKINGEIADEHNTLISYTPIYLECSFGWGDEVDATISLTNRITLKINNRLYN